MKICLNPGLLCGCEFWTISNIMTKNTGGWIWGYQRNVDANLATYIVFTSSIVRLKAKRLPKE